jgi:glycosyltransferase involved in cell wall biosynthesis
MIKVLHLISSLNIGGAEQNLRNLVEKMDTNEFRNTIVSMTDIGMLGEGIIRLGIPVIMLNMKKGVPDPRGILRLHRIVKTLQPDIIQTWMYHANILGLLFSTPRPVIWNIRCSDMDLSRYGLIYRLTVQAGALMSGRPALVIANAYAGKSAHERFGYHPRRWEVIPNGFDTERFKPDVATRDEVRRELQIPPEAISVGLIARFDPMKDHQNFFKAMYDLQSMYPDVHYVLAGRGIDAANPAFHSLKPPITDNLHLIGERHDIHRILAALDISILSSSFGEGFPTIIGESMSAGVPCVVTDTGDAPILVGDTGIVVPRRNPKALASAISGLIHAGPAARAALGHKARIRILDQYSIDLTVKQYETLYKELRESCR